MNPGIAQFLWETLASGAWGAALLAAAAFLFKGQIAHWLNKDLEHAKAQHQRELEAYKVSLIAEAERTKSASEVKRAAALKILEKKFAALDTFHKLSAGCAADLASTAALAPNQKSVDFWNAAHGRVKQLNAVANELSLFLDRDQQQVLIRYRTSLSALLKHCVTGSPAVAAADQVNAVAFQAEIAADRLVDALAKEMQRLD